MSTTTTSARPNASTFHERAGMNGGATSSKAQTNDPFQALADAMEAAARDEEQKPQARPQPTEKKSATAAEPRSAPTGAYSKAVYTAAYGVSFGLTFPAFFMLGLLPTEGAIARGLRDGAQAARDSMTGE